MRAARGYVYLPYHNDVEGDCVDSAYAHAIHAMTGKAPFDSDQQKLVKATSDMNGTQPGWLMWKMFFRSLDHFRQKSFGTVGTSQSQAQWAINRYGAFIACVDGGAHQVAAIDYDVGGIYVVALTVAGKVEYVPWAIYIAIAGRGTFAFTNRFDPVLLGNAFVYNIWQPLIWLIALALGLYFGGVI